MLQSMSLKVRQLALVVLGAVGLLLITLLSLYTLYQSMLEDRIDKTRNLVETLDSVLDDLNHAVNKGDMTLEEAQAEALKVIRPIRYDGDNYFWINDMQPRMIMHPMKPALDNTDLSGISDPNGKRLFVEMTHAVRNANNEGKVDYVWNKPGEPEPVAKISYVKLFQPWGWIVGTGIYVDDVQKAILEKAYVLMGIALAVLGVMITLALFISSSIIGPLQGFSKNLTQTAGHVKTIIQQSTEATNSLAAATEETSAQSVLISDSAKEAEEQVAGVHTALEELNISINDISSNVNGVNDFVDQAVNKAAHTNQVVSQLTETTEEITAVVTLINTLADQTNLLALNAAIEAARAGDAGRGFAVVADEVKKLATNTSNATGQIGENVANIKHVSDECALALKDVIDAVQRIQDNTTAMSAAVEEQTSVVQNVTNNMRMTAEQVSSVTTNVQAVKEAVGDSSQATNELSDVSNDLNSSFTEMYESAMSTFKSLGLQSKS